jgi:hypothetical protein
MTITISEIRVILVEVETPEGVMVVVEAANKGFQPHLLRVDDI